MLGTVMGVSGRHQVGGQGVMGILGACRDCRYSGARKGIGGIMGYGGS